MCLCSSQNLGYLLEDQTKLTTYWGKIQKKNSCNFDTVVFRSWKYWNFQKNSPNLNFFDESFHWFILGSCWFSWWQLFEIFNVGFYWQNGTWNCLEDGLLNFFPWGSLKHEKLRYFLLSKVFLSLLIASKFLRRLKCDIIKFPLKLSYL